MFEKAPRKRQRLRHLSIKVNFDSKTRPKSLNIAIILTVGDILFEKLHQNVNDTVA